MEPDDSPKIIDSVAVTVNKDYCKIIFSDGGRLNLPVDLVVKYVLKKNTVIQPELFEKLLGESNIISAKRTAYGLMTRKPRSEQELKTKLKEKNFNTEAISAAVDFCKNFNLIDDEKFALNFAEIKFKIKKWTSQRIYFELLRKGVDKNIALKASSIAKDPDMAFSNALALAEKKLKLLNRKDENKQKKSVINSLKSKGYGWTTIKLVIEKLFVAKN